METTGGQAQLAGGDDLARDLPEDRGTAELLLEEVGAVTGKPRNLIGEVDIPRLFELLDLVLGGDLVEHRLEAVVGQDVELDPLHLPPDPDEPAAGRRRDAGPMPPGHASTGKRRQSLPWMASLDDSQTHDCFIKGTAILPAPGLSSGTDMPPSAGMLRHCGVTAGEV